jgi:hypothetical protein
MLYLHIAYTRIVVVFMTCFYIVSVLNKPHIHHHTITQRMQISVSGLLFLRVIAICTGTGINTNENVGHNIGIFERSDNLNCAIRVLGGDNHRGAI